MAYKRLLGQRYQKIDASTETLTQALSANFEKNMNTTINTSARLPQVYSKAVARKYSVKKVLSKIS